VELHGRLGALAERNFRLIFSSTSISAFGDGVSTVVPATLFADFAIQVICFAVIIGQPSVWAIRSGGGGWRAGAEATA
jgi:hypothetical protein